MKKSVWKRLLAFFLSVVMAASCLTPAMAANGDAGTTAKPPAPTGQPEGDYTMPSDKLSGTNSPEPMSDGDVHSYFRIPAMVTLPNGWIVAAADARWPNTEDSPNNLDTIVSVSKDGGETWDWEIVNYFADFAPLQGSTYWYNGIKGINDSASFIDPALVWASGKLWMAVDLQPTNVNGTANAQKAGSGFDGNGYLIVGNIPEDEYASVVKGTEGHTASSAQTYIEDHWLYRADINGTPARSIQKDGKTVNLYPIFHKNGKENETGYYVDSFFDLWYDYGGDGGLKPVLCRQKASDHWESDYNSYVDSGHYVQSNLFYIQSDWRAYSTTYLMIRSATVNETTGKLEWSDPMLINDGVKEDGERFLVFCPGRGITVDVDGHERIIFQLYDNNTVDDNGEAVGRASSVYSDDGGRTWQRGERTMQLGPTGTATESQTVILPNGNLRMYSRNNQGYIGYADSTDNGETWGASKLDTNLPYCSNCMVSFINLDGCLISPDNKVYQNLILASYPRESYRRSGVIRIGSIGTDADHTVTWLNSDAIRFSGRYNYSVLTQLLDDNGKPADSFAVLYEQDTVITAAKSVMAMNFVKLTAADLLGSGWRLVQESGVPATKPTVGNELYQVEVMCQENSSHWWSGPGENNWTMWVNDFAVGEIEINTAYQPGTYPWRCAVTPKETLATYLGKLNSKVGNPAHRLLTTELPVAYYYFNNTTSEWEFIKDPAANPNCTVSTNGNNTWYLQIKATCAEPEWLTSMDITGYDLFTKAPAGLPGTADGKYLILAQSGAAGDTDVYALYLNPAPCESRNGVNSGQGVTAARLAMEDGQLAGYLAQTDEKVTLDQLLMTVTASGGGFEISNGGNYLRVDANLMVGTSPAALTIRQMGQGAAYQIQGERYLTLYVQGQNPGSSNWCTNFWGPLDDPGATGASGSGYVYFLHPHVDDSKTVAAFDADGDELQDEDGYFTIPTGGCIKIDGETTFTVPLPVRSVRVHKNYASSLKLDAVTGGFGVTDCVITMQNGDTTDSIERSGKAGSGVYFARTGGNALYFAGEGEMMDISSRNTVVPAWLTSIGDRTLRSVYIGEGITSVGSNAFKFTALSSVTLSNGLERIGDSAFESCCIETIDIPATVTDIGDNAFKGCLGLRSISLPGGVTSIGANAFANCTRLRSVTFAGALGTIPNGAFQAISGHGQMNLVFLADAPATAYTDFEGMLPFLHQNGAIVYTQTAPSASLVKSGGSGDAYFAVLGGASLTGIDLRCGVLPELPAKNGQAFTGWQVGSTTEILPAGSAVSGQPAGTVFTARWGSYSVTYTVTIDGVEYTVAQGQTMGSQMPDDPVREGWCFTGWVDANGESFTAGTVITGDTVVTSTWTAIPTYTVSFDANGGVLEGSASLTVYEGDQLTLSQLPSVSREGYTFDGWYTGDGSLFSGAEIRGNLTLIAHWTEEGEEPEPSVEPTTPPTPSGPSWFVPAPVKPEDPAESDPGTLPSEPPFQDVGQDAWYASSVAYVYAQGLMRGVSDTSFDPEGTLTRGMMAQIMYNMAEEPEAPITAIFSDLKAGAYYTDAVAWGVANGVLMGYSATVFGGEEDLTREQMAVMLYRYVQAQEPDKDVDMSVLAAFSDSGQISDWAEAAMAWAVESGLFKGRGNGELDPKANISRAEVAAVLERYGKRFLP